VQGLTQSFAVGGPFSRARKTVLHDVSLQVARGEVVALVGESGSGKSTLARVLARLETPSAGRVLLGGRDVLAEEPRAASLSYRSRVQLVFQDPFASLNPVHRVADALARPLERHGKVGPGGLTARVHALLASVGLTPPERYAQRFPNELSGGQRQRVAVARALAVEPELVIADEPTSMLDVSTRMGVLELLGRLTRERGLGILFITHDLASARHLADRVVVLYAGRVVEEGPTARVLDAPAHPYTRLLRSAVPDGHAFLSTPLPARPVPAGPPPPEGCAFAPRCPEALAACHAVLPPEQSRAVSHRVRCHLSPSSLALSKGAAGHAAVP
jgi:oligopeptide/dipeptide ABC transporter ATP-binding protein